MRIPIRRDSRLSIPLVSTLAITALLTACDSAVDPSGTTRTSLALDIQASAAAVANAGRIHLSGPSTSTSRTISPGGTVEFDELEPGSYTVSLEALVGSEVEGFARTTTSVTAGRTSNVTLTNNANFAPSISQAPSSVDVGEPFNVVVQSRSFATGYVVEWDDNPGFNSPQSEQITGTSTSLTLNQPGVYSVRARALSPYGNRSLPGADVSVEVRAGVGSVEVAPPSATIEVGETVELSATVRSTLGDILPGETVSWESNDDGVASVNSSGLVTGTGPGQVLIRARSTSNTSITGSATITVLEPPSSPVLSNYMVTFGPVVADCHPFLGFRTDEEFVYTDANGDVPTGGVLVEPGNIESQWRYEGDANWSDFFEDKAWAFEESSDGSSGTLRDAASTCWLMPDGQTFVDYRVRLQDSNGNWSDWIETRVYLPVSVEIDPSVVANLVDGGTQQYSAIARDVNGNVVPGDPINWSNHNRPAVGTIDADGLYQHNAGVNGLDRVYARAGEAFGLGGIRGADPVAEGAYFAPCFTGTRERATPGWIDRRMMVYAGRQYLFTLSDGGGASGNPDLYIRFGDAFPTQTEYTERSIGAGFEESITWTPDADGNVWISIYTASSYANVRFDLNTTDGNCGFPGTETLPAPPAIGGHPMNSVGPEGGTPLTDLRGLGGTVRRTDGPRVDPERGGGS